jgi:hypothetical protein
VGSDSSERDLERIMSMRNLIILLVTTGCAAAQQPVVFRTASVGAAATNPDYWRTPIKVCGHVLEGRGREGESILTRTEFGDSSWLLVDVGAERPQSGKDACVRGVVRRRDGLTEAEAGAQGRLRSIADAPNPDYVLYPCSDAVSCRKAGGTIPR